MTQDGRRFTDFPSSNLRTSQAASLRTPDPVEASDKTLLQLQQSFVVHLDSMKLEAEAFRHGRTGHFRARLRPGSTLGATTPGHTYLCYIRIDPMILACVWLTLVGQMPTRRVGDQANADPERLLGEGWTAMGDSYARRKLEIRANQGRGGAGVRASLGP